MSHEMLTDIHAYSRPVTKKAGIGLVRVAAYDYAVAHNAVVLVRPVGAGKWQGFQKRIAVPAGQAPPGYGWLVDKRRVRSSPVRERGGKVVVAVQGRYPAGRLLVKIIHPHIPEVRYAEE